MTDESAQIDSYIDSLGIESWAPLTDAERDLLRRTLGSNLQVFGAQVRRLRLVRGWTAEQAAEIAGVAQKTWARVESGRGVRAASIARIAEALGLEAADAREQLHQPPSAPTEAGGDARRVKALAAIVKIVRSRDGKSIEACASEASLGHMTWRRLEEGNPVRTSTYAALDKLYDLPSGTVLRAMRSDGGIVDLANHFSIGAVEARESSPAEFVAALSGDTAPTLTPPTPRQIAFDAFDVTTLRRLVAVLQVEIARIEQENR